MTHQPRANMDNFHCSVWDRLGAPADAANGDAPARLSLAQYKRVLARDLEALLNTRSAMLDDTLAPFPCCRQSIVNFGLADFAQLCLTSSDDRKEICDRLTAAIARHEPRLEQVRAHLVHEPGVINRLSFVISGVLRARSDDDRVRFDVMLEPSSLHYSIR